MFPFCLSSLPSFSLLFVFLSLLFLFSSLSSLLLLSLSSLSFAFYSRYYFFLLRDPAGLCWFSTYPFKRYQRNAIAPPPPPSSSSSSSGSSTSIQVGNEEDEDDGVGIAVVDQCSAEEMGERGRGVDLEAGTYVIEEQKEQVCI